MKTQKLSKLEFNKGTVVELNDERLGHIRAGSTSLIVGSIAGSIIVVAFSFGVIHGVTNHTKEDPKTNTNPTQTP